MEIKPNITGVNHELRRELCNFQYWLAHNHKGKYLPTDSTTMTKRAIAYLEEKATL